MVQPIFITIDPERDTPTALAEYVPLFDAGIIGLTGTSEADRPGTAGDLPDLSSSGSREPLRPGWLYNGTYITPVPFRSRQAGFVESWPYGTPAEEILARFERKDLIVMTRLSGETALATGLDHRAHRHRLPCSSSARFWGRRLVCSAGFSAPSCSRLAITLGLGLWWRDRNVGPLWNSACAIGGGCHSTLASSAFMLGLIPERIQPCTADRSRPAPTTINWSLAFRSPLMALIAFAMIGAAVGTFH